MPVIALLPASGQIIGSEHILPIRVYFEDTDFSGLVYHANYLRYMERARSDMLRVAGIDQKAAFEEGLGFYAVAELSIKYRAPARFDDALEIVSTIKQVRAASCLIHQRVMRNEQLLAEADVFAAFLSGEGKPKRQPAAWIAAFNLLMKE
jgi:acyl-CoA thioester hydrolase